MTSLPLRHGPAARDVQGNVLAAFNKPRVTFLLIALPENVVDARAWLGEIAPLVATTGEVESFYERRRSQGGDRLAATWTGVGLTWHGLNALAPHCDVARDLADHWAFRVGAAARAPDLGDAPERWLFGRDAASDPDAGVIDAVVTIASDSDDGLRTRRKRVLRSGKRHGCRTVFEQRCAVLPGALKGREHFGFKDGISQPGVKQFHAPDRLYPEERAGHRGQLLVEPGEFVLGLPRQDGQPVAVADWLLNASFQVVRRLDQDVAGWRKASERAGSSPDAADPWAARLVGRSQSGTALAARGNPDGEAFDYRNDGAGAVTPRFAHIRKVFPRGDDRFEPQRHRLMRRGIPFGPPYQVGEDDTERGMVFNAFMASIERQFEYVQRLFANKPDFPEDGDGPDALIGGRDPVASASGSYEPARLNTRGEGGAPVVLERFVETRGAVYALAPSKSALAWLATGGSDTASSS